MYKSKLQEFCHKHSWDLPVYTSVKDGPDHCPRFTSTVTVNGMSFQSPNNESKSSKDSQNMAAKLAFDYLSSSANSCGPSTPSPSVPSPSSLPASGNKLLFGPATNELLQQKLGGNVQNSITNDTSPRHKDDSNPKDLLHLYKNRLQHYAQKNNLSLPEYSCEFDGPPHARQFRASVTIDGRTYKSSKYYPNLKDAEHAAAKSALESLSVVEIQENEGLYKTLLQELAHKEGFHFPSYTTTKSGPSHMPTFVSSVEVGGEIYQGGECKTKKQSEMNAAKVAYNKLIDRTAVSHCSPLSTSRKNVEIPSASSQPINGDNCLQSGAKITQENHMKRAAGERSEMDRCGASIVSPGNHVKELLELPSSGLGSVVTDDSLQNIQPKDTHTVTKKLDAEVEVKSDETRLAEGSKPPGSKILVFRRGSNLEIPEGASALPYHDDKWVAVRVESNQDQQV